MKTALLHHSQTADSTSNSASNNGAADASNDQMHATQFLGEFSQHFAEKTELGANAARFDIHAAASSLNPQLGAAMLQINRGFAAASRTEDPARRKNSLMAYRRNALHVSRLLIRELKRSCPSEVANLTRKIRRQNEESGVTRVSAQQLATLTSRCQDQESDSRENRECAICGEEIIRNQLQTLLPCNCPPFHTGCIREWLSQTTSCPVCMSDTNLEATKTASLSP